MWFSLMVTSVILVYGEGQYTVIESPCPGTFDYKTDRRGVVFGFIEILNTGGPARTLDLRANFTVAARLSSSYVGQITTVNTDSNLVNFNQGLPLQYRVDFPVTSSLPRLTSLSANGDVICYGPPDVASPHKYVSAISLQHMLFLMGQPGSGGFRPHPPHRPQHKPNKPDLTFFNDLPPDAQIFMLTETGNQQQLQPVSHEQFDQALQSVTQRPDKPPPQSYPDLVPQRPFHPEMVTQAPTLPPMTMTTTTLRPQLTTALTEAPPRQGDIVSSITTSVQCGVVAGGDHQPLIFNGQSYTRGEWPWVVAIYKRKDGSLSFICSGTLVSDQHVVTAAHCMHVKNSITSKKDIVVKVGVYNLEDWGDDITMTRTLHSANIHDRYNSSSLANDILVLTLDRGVEFNANIRPACLWSGSSDLTRIVGASGVVAGWGQSERGPEGQGEPRIARIPVVSTSACRASRPDFHKLTSEFTLCAGDRNGVGPCLGDSGGGFLLIEAGRWQLRGVVSLSLRPDNGDLTCNLDEYIVFTDVAKYIDWIRSIIGR